MALLAALLVLVLLVGCEPAEWREKRRVLRELLDERATKMPALRRAQLARALVDAERETGVDALLSLAVVEQESRYDAQARGRQGGLGLMQVRAETGRAVAERIGLRWRGPDDLLDPATNVRIGVAYLAELREEFGNWESALTAYNAGPGRVKRTLARGRKPWSRFTRQVLARHREFRGRVDPGTGQE